MINPAHDTPLSDKEIDDLDARLLDSSLDAPMDISMLDGFLCAVLSGPRLVPPSEWLPWVWDHEAAEQAPQFRSDKDAKHLAGLVMRFGNEIARGLRGCENNLCLRQRKCARDVIEIRRALRARRR